MLSISRIAAALLLASPASTAPTTRQSTLPDLKPVILTDFPDPSIIKVSNTWYAFASQSAFDFKSTKVQLATSPDFETWTLTSIDALRKVASWVNIAAGAVWAPSVSQREDGKFVMYYSATTNTAGDGKFHCIGVAVSDDVEGPYDDESDDGPWVCPTERGGALDASVLRDVDGQSYVLYKIDANAMGHGGTCGNTVEPIVRTPIMIQRVEGDGITRVGEAVEILTNSDLDGPLVEAPYMVRNSDGLYVLFFSSNCWTTDLYDVSYATSESPLGPFTKATVPLAVTGTRGLIGPGGASIAGEDGSFFAMHGYAKKEDVGFRRAMYVSRMGYRGSEVVWQ